MRWPAKGSRGWLTTLMVVALASSAVAADNERPKRIVSAGASVTEILFALGAGESVVASDLSSQFPAAAKAMPKVGYHRSLTAEGILAQRPDLVLVTDEAGPPTTLRQLRSAGVSIQSVPSKPTAKHAMEKVLVVGKAVGKDREAKDIVATMTKELEAIRQQQAATPGKKPRVLFIYARGSGALMVSGKDTAAASIIELAGAQNAVTGFSEYKPLTAEAVVAAAPDVILIPARALPVVGGIDGVLAAPGITLTPAGRAKRIVAIDDVLLLCFGPRLPQAIRWLSRALDDKVEP